MSFRIETIHAFVAVDDDDEEGLTGFMSESGWMPMVAADPTRLESLRPIAQQIAAASGATIKLVRFSQREELEVIAP